MSDKIEELLKLLTEETPTNTVNGIKSIPKPLTNKPMRRNDTKKKPKRKTKKSVNN